MASERGAEGLGRKYQVEPHRLAGRDLARVPCSEFCAGAIGVDRFRIAGDDAPVKRVLHIWRGVGHAPQALRIGLVLGEKQLAWLASIEVVVTERRVIGTDRPGGVRR